MNEIKLTAPTDIEVYIYLTRHQLGSKYCYWGHEMQFDAINKKQNGFNVHPIAWYKEEKAYTPHFKAFIKKGTDFVVDADSRFFWAPEIYLTKQAANEFDICPQYDIVSKLVLEYAHSHDEFKNTDGVHIGDFYMSDHTYVSPYEAVSNDSFKKDEVIGSVAFFDDNDKPVIISHEQDLLLWTTKKADHSLDTTFPLIDIKKHESDMNGQKNFETLAQLSTYNPRQWPAMAYVLKYQPKGTTQGDWYIGSVGEYLKLQHTLHIVNCAIFFARITDLTLTEGTYGYRGYIGHSGTMTSTMYKSNHKSDGTYEIHPTAVYLGSDDTAIVSSDEKWWVRPLMKGK